MPSIAKDFSSHQTLIEQAEAGCPIAQRCLGNFYLDKEDFVQAREWHEKAAAQNDPVALLMLGDAYKKCGDIKEAMGYYIRSKDAADQCGDEEWMEMDIAGSKLGRIIEIANMSFSLGMTELQKGNKPKAIERFTMALEHGDPSAGYNLACLYSDENQQEKAYEALNEALSWTDCKYVTSPDEIKGTILNRLAMMLYEGQGCAENKSLACEYLEKAVEYRNINAMDNMIRFGFKEEGQAYSKDCMSQLFFRRLVLEATSECGAASDASEADGHSDSDASSVCSI